MFVFGRQVSETPSDWPTLSCKAAHARHLLPAIHMACRTIAFDFGVTSTEFKLQRYMLQKLNRFYQIITQHGHYMPTEASAEALQCAEGFLCTQNALGQHFHQRRPPLLLFHVTFKSHLFWHMAWCCQFFNPRCGWCYRDESFVGRLAKVARSVVHGLGHLKVAVSLAQKWRWVLFLRMLRRSGNT